MQPNWVMSNKLNIMQEVWCEEPASFVGDKKAKEIYSGNVENNREDSSFLDPFLFLIFFKISVFF